MKPENIARFRHRVRSTFGWALILAVALAELWLIGQFTRELGRSANNPGWQLQEPYLSFAVR